MGQDVETGACIHELFEAQARSTPDHIAVAFGSRELSYRALDARANHLARRLSNLGVGPEVLVGIADERSIDTIVGLLAILKAGGAYVPIDLGSPRERRDQMLADSGVNLVLASRRVAPALSKVVFLDEEIGDSDVGPGTRCSPEQLAYALYTSGSTGTPKAVCVPHRAVVRLVRRANFLSIAATDAVLQFAPLAFDASTFEIWGPLLNGARLCVAAPGPTSVEDLGEQVLRHRITIVWLTAGLFHQVVDAGLHRFSSVRHLLAGGDVLSPVHVRKALEALPGCTLYNGYGPTENTTFTCVHTMRNASDVDEPVSIGRPITGTTVHLLDDHLQPVTEGRLFAGASGLARGYHDRPALTAEKFIPSPFGPPGARLYDTGDYARDRPDGTVEFLGRRDAQVKVRGFRIELGEIEMALLRAGVREALVVAREDTRGDKQLVGYVVGDVATLREVLKTKLPAYMVPAAIVVLDQMPLTPNGKVDRKALASPTWDATSVGELPATRTERDLAAIFTEYLGKAPIYRGDRFFELGGHSLLAARVITGVRNTLGVKLSLRTLLESATLAEAAAEIDRELAAGRIAVRDVATEIPRRADPQRAVASLQQESIWAYEQKSPGTRAYINALLVRLRGPLKPALVERVLNELAARHEAWRAGFVFEGGVLEMRFARTVRIVVRHVDESQCPPHEREARLAALAASLGRPFDLTKPPLVRATLVRYAADDHVLVNIHHHLITDGWSEHLIAEELVELYDAYARGEPARAIDLACRYGDLTSWQRAIGSSADHERQRTYWRRLLRNPPPPIELPVLPAAVPATGTRSRVFTLPIADSARLRSWAKDASVTLSMLFTTVFSVLLSRYAQTEELLLGVTLAARRHPASQRLIGLFARTLPIRIAVTPDETLRTLMSRVRDAVADAEEHSDVTLAEIAGDLLAAGTVQSTRLLPIVIVQAPPMGTLHAADIAIFNDSIEIGDPMADLYLNCVENADGAISQRWGYDPARLAERDVDAIGESFLHLVSELVEHPDRRVGEATILPAAERDRLLAMGHGPTRPQAERCMHELFIEQATRTPDAIAVVHAGHALSYRDLDRRSNQLARMLRQLGIGRGDRVGIWLDRSAEMIVAVLGVLEAGATYVPIEVSWPLDRVHWVLASLDAPCIVTERSLLRSLHDLRWRLPHLRSAVCLDLESVQLPSEPLDVASVRSLWDHIAGGTNRIAQGGFVSSYTGELFSAEEVDQYRDHVLALAEPYLGANRRVLEIGCGNGELMFAIGPRVAHYVGLDPSEAMQQLNRDRVRREGPSNIELLTGFAHEIDRLGRESFDLVVVASAAQFFPGPIYFERTLEAAFALLRPGGAVVLADLLDARQKSAYVESVSDFVRTHPSARARARFDGELYVEEQFVREVAAGIGADALVLPRTGFSNELRFRFDAILTKPAVVRAPQRSDRVVTRGHIDRLSDAPFASTTSPDDLAYIIFTSGSTGTPKGVMVRHRAVINLIDWVNHTFAVGPRDRLLFVTSLCFDLSVFDIFGTLAAGGSIRVASTSELHDPKRLFEILTTEPITFWDSAPAALQLLAAQLEGHTAGGSLRLVFLSGDWIPVTLPDAVRRAFPSARVISLGGATEATVWSNFYPIGEVDPSWSSIPYGKPIQNARYHVLDEHLEPRPIGVAGDLYIGGDCLTDGYANDAALTASKFIPDPFSARTSDRLYRTGDLARYWADGNLEFLGRSDLQVKIRGFRVELGEIDAVLLQHPGVREAVTIASRDDRRLVVYFVPRSPPPTPSDLRRHLHEKLPDYMVPSAFVVLDVLPLTSNGKLDRNALPSPSADAFERATYAAPRSPVEQILAQIWAELLGMERVGVDDDFVALGGHSLLGISVISRIRVLFAVEVPVGALFGAATVANLAAWLCAQIGTEQAIAEAQLILADEGA